MVSLPLCRLERFLPLFIYSDAFKSVGCLAPLNVHNSLSKIINGHLSNCPHRIFYSLSKHDFISFLFSRGTRQAYDKLISFSTKYSPPLYKDLQGPLSGLVMVHYNRQTNLLARSDFKLQNKQQPLEASYCSQYRRTGLSLFQLR